VAGGLALHNLGLVSGTRWLLREVTLDTAATGVLGVQGPEPGIQALGRVLARHVLPSVRVWGSITLGGIDLRVAPPAALVVGDGKEEAGDVASMILSRVAAPTLLRLLASSAPSPGARAVAYVDQVLQEHLLGELSPTTPLRSLTRSLRLQLELAAAAVTGARAIWVTSSFAELTGAELAPVVRLLRRLADKALVIVAEAATAAAVALDAPVVTLPAVREGAAVAATDPLDHGGLPGFRWIVAGQLAGMARPGSGLQELDRDIAALLALRVAAVVTVEEVHVNQQALVAAGIEAWHLPTVDMSVPERAAARATALAAAQLMDRGQLVIFHCRGGVGRTGTLLACTLMMRGHSAGHSLELLRQINAHYVQSAEQLDFLHKFLEAA
jgi:Protein-tyrosine phosphatase